MQRLINVVAGCISGALVVALLASPVCGGGLVERFLTTGPGEKPSEGTTDITIYKGGYYWNEGVDQPGGDISWLQHDLSVYVPLRKTPTYDVFGYMSGQWLDIDTNAVLPTTGGASSSGGMQ